MLRLCGQGAIAAPAQFMPLRSVVRGGVAEFVLGDTAEGQAGQGDYCRTRLLCRDAQRVEVDPARDAVCVVVVDVATTSIALGNHRLVGPLDAEFLEPCAQFFYRTRERRFAGAVAAHRG